jgi:hypothetical protein
VPDPSAPPRPRRRAPAIAAACVPAVLAALPALAVAAPAITTDSVCLRPGQTPAGGLVSPALRIAGTGFGPGASVELRRGARTTTLTAGADGTLSARVSVLDLLVGGVPRSTPFTVVATDAGGPGGSPPPQGASNALRLRAAPLAFSASPRQARPSSRVTFRFSGFRPGAVIWAHYRHRGRVRADVPMGRAGKPCGLLTARRRQIPVAAPGTGTWSVQFDNRPRFSPHSRPRARATITVVRTAR